MEIQHIKTAKKSCFEGNIIACIKIYKLINHTDPNAIKSISVFKKKNISYPFQFFQRVTSIHWINKEMTPKIF